MVGGLITRFYPNLIQHVFSAHLFLLVQNVFGKPPRTSSSQFMGQARALGPEAWVKQKKGPGAMSLGQAKALEPFAWAKRKLKAG